MEPAGFFRRIFSLMYDTLFVLAVVICLSLLLNVINGEAPKPGTFLSVIQLFIAVTSGPFFYCYFWQKNKGQTLGMQAWKIKLISEEELTLRICLLRCAFSTFSFLILGIGYFYILFNKEKRSLADIATSTRISKIY